MCNLSFKLSWFICKTIFLDHPNKIGACSKFIILYHPNLIMKMFLAFHLSSLKPMSYHQVLDDYCMIMPGVNL